MLQPRRKRDGQAVTGGSGNALPACLTGVRVLPSTTILTAIVCPLLVMGDFLHLHFFGTKQSIIFWWRHACRRKRFCLVKFCHSVQERSGPLGFNVYNHKTFSFSGRVVHGIMVPPPASLPPPPPPSLMGSHAVGSLRRGRCVPMIPPLPVRGLGVLSVRCFLFSVLCFLISFCRLFSVVTTGTQAVASTTLITS